MQILQNILGLADMTEQIIATDFLMDTKAAVRNYAIAISETRSSKVREVLIRHLNDAIDTHESILAFMMEKGYYNVYEPLEQVKLDMKSSDAALKLKK